MIRVCEESHDIYKIIKRIQNIIAQTYVQLNLCTILTRMEYIKQLFIKHTSNNSDSTNDNNNNNNNSTMNKMEFRYFLGECMNGIHMYYIHMYYIHMYYIYTCRPDS